MPQSLNPSAALGALTEADGLTLGQFALLEKIGCPYLIGDGEATAADIIPSVYLMRFPSKEAVRHLPTLTDEAFDWADTLTPAEFRAERAAFEQRLNTFFAVLEKPAGGQEKNAPAPVTAG